MTGEVIMGKLKLNLACGSYDRTQALMDGTVQIEGVELNYIALGPSELFWRMLNNEEFDVSEMSLSSYAIMRSEGDQRFIALPVFPSRIFRHSCVYIHPDSGIRSPDDLRGKRVGVGDYQMTAAVWARGFLEHDYGVKPEDMHWVVGTPVRKIRMPDGLHIESTQPGQSLDELLVAGEIDALISVIIPPALKAGSPGVRRLFPDHRRVERDYYERTKIFPIMHTLAIKSRLVEAEPWLPVSIYKAFLQAKEINYRRLYDTNALKVSLPWLIDELERLREVFGDDIWNYSIEGSRPTLETFVSHMDEQGLTRRKMSVEELFVPNISENLAHYLRSIGEV
jgi:4,5-dihydroxyphthalate decarboxylase